MNNPINNAIARIILPYVVAAGLWVVLSDWLIFVSTSDSAIRTDWFIVTDLAFVAITALLLAFLLRAEFRKQEANLSALREREEQIHRSQLLLQAVTEGTPDSIYVKDVNGRYLMFNSGASKISGKTKEEVLGKDDTALFSADEVRALIAVDRRVLASGVTQSEEQLVTINGEARTFLTTKGPMRDATGHITGLFGISHDITERKLHEMEAERMKRLYGALCQLNQCIVRAQSREDLFVKICQALVESGQFRMAWIGLVNKETMAVNVAAQSGDAGGYLESIQMFADDRPEGRGPTGICIRAARPYICNDFFADPSTMPWREAARKHGWAAMFNAPVRLAGKVIGVLGVYATEKGFFGEKEAMLLEEVAVDISFAMDFLRQEQSRQQAEEALRESEQKWQTIINTSPDGIAIVSLDGLVLFVSGKLLALHGYQKLEEVTGRHMFDFLDATYHDQARAGFQAVLQGQNIGPTEYLLVKKDGTRFFSEINTEVLRSKDGTPASIFFVERDITARKQAEETNRQLMVAIDQAAESIVFTDADANIRYVNQGFERITGYARQEVLGRNSRLLKSGNQPVTFYKDMWSILAHGQVWRGRFTNRRKDGQLFEEDATISPIRNAEGQINSYVAVKRDITRELQLERQFIEAQKMEAVGQLAGGVAHDYNNILAASMMQLGMLLSEPGLTPDMREGLEALKMGADRAAKLTRQLLMFSRRQAMQKQPLEFNALLDNELKMLRRLLGEHIELTLQTQSGEAWIEADAGMMEQVIMNLCINARDAMPKGGKLMVGIKSVEFLAAAQTNPEARPGKFVCLSVADVGCGMSAKTMERIFEPFFTTKEVGKGTGLGLATAYGIVKQHNGWIEVSSEIDQGSEFRVFLPAVEAVAITLTKAVSPPVSRGTETILVVEDEEPLRKSVVSCLKYAGYHVLEAANGPEALELWREQVSQFDLLLTDMIMPGGMNGLELAETFKNLKPALAVIVTSGYSDQVIQSGIPAKPGFAYLSKPCDTSTLTSAVRKSLDESNRERNSKNNYICQKF